MRSRTAVVLGALAVSSIAVAVACSGDDNAATGTGGDGGASSSSGATSSGSSSGTSSSSSGGSSSGSSSGGSSSGSSSGTTDGGGVNDAGIIVGPTSITFPTGGSPDAILWDSAKKTLFIVDDNNNQVWTWTDLGGFVKYGTVPDDPAADDAGHTKLNGVAELADGTLVITRFGYGTVGNLYTLSPDGGTTTVPNIDATRKRIDVTVDPATGTIYGDSFSGSGSATVGTLETVSLTAGETTYATGFVKPVGLLVQGGNVIVSDQTPNLLYAIPTDPTLIADGGAGLIDGGPFQVVATPYSPDQLSAGPNGSILTDQFKTVPDGGGPEIRQIDPTTGAVTQYTDAGFTSLSAVAYDATNARIFVVDNNGTTVRLIWIFPAH